MTLTRKQLIVLGALLAAVVVYLVADALWVTDEEKLHRLVAKLEKAVEARDAEGCVALADEESWDWPGTREELAELLRRLFEACDVENVRIVREVVKPDPPQGTIHAITVVFLGGRSPFPGPVRNTWVLDCTKKDGRWLISRAHIELEDGTVESVPGLVGRASRPLE